MFDNLNMQMNVRELPEGCFFAVELGTGVGFLHPKFTQAELKPIRDEVDEIIKNKFKGSKKFNKDLAGNIEHEYLIESDCKKHISKIITPLLEESDARWNIISGASYLTEKLPLTIDNVWVNFQKKHEFNPPHIHRGVMSFVIWLDIPYDIKDEMSVVQSVNSGSNIPGHFQFEYVNPLGKIHHYNIPADKTFNGTGLIFPSDMFHAVYPFTTSDDYRITISGNFKYDVKPTKIKKRVV